MIGIKHKAIVSSQNRSIDRQTDRKDVLFQAAEKPKKKRNLALSSDSSMIPTVTCWSSLDVPTPNISEDRGTIAQEVNKPLQVKLMAEFQEALTNRI